MEALCKSGSLFEVTVPDYRQLKACHREVGLLKELWDMIVMVSWGSLGPAGTGCGGCVRTSRGAGGRGHPTGSPWPSLSVWAVVSPSICSLSCCSILSPISSPLQGHLSHSGAPPSDRSPCKAPASCHYLGVRTPVPFGRDISTRPQHTQLPRRELVALICAARSRPSLSAVLGFRDSSVPSLRNVCSCLLLPSDWTSLFFTVEI